MKQIKEEDGTHKQFMERAKKIQNSEELKIFVDELTNNYGHDYGTICHAVAAAAIGAAHAVNRSNQGGITGFQAGAVMWEMIRGWGIFGEGPLQIVEWNHLLYPQYDYQMPRTISKNALEQLIDMAQKKLAESTQHTIEPVLERWEMIAAGKLPAGMEIRE